jgi:hypothetical protein
MPQSCGHGTHILLSPPKEGMLEDFFTTPEKSNGFGRD